MPIISPSERSYALILVGRTLENLPPATQEAIAIHKVARIITTIMDLGEIRAHIDVILGNVLGVDKRWTELLARTHTELATLFERDKEPVGNEG